jgi:hypothetical protein
VAQTTGVALATPMAALSGPIPKAPGFAGGYLPLDDAVGVAGAPFSGPMTDYRRLPRGNKGILARRMMLNSAENLRNLTARLAIGYLINIYFEMWI